jgi:hypothetical protein
MRQIRRARRPGPASEQQSPLPADPRDPDIVYAHQVAHHTSRSCAAVPSQAGTPSPRQSRKPVTRHARNSPALLTGRRR